MNYRPPSYKDQSTTPRRDLEVQDNLRNRDCNLYHSQHSSHPWRNHLSPAKPYNVRSRRTSTFVESWRLLVYRAALTARSCIRVRHRRCEHVRTMRNNHVDAQTATRCETLLYASSGGLASFPRIDSLDTRKSRPDTTTNPTSLTRISTLPAFRYPLSTL